VVSTELDVAGLVSLAQSGGAQEVLVRTAELADEVSGEADRARLDYATAIAHLMRGESVQAVAAAERMADHARAADSVGLELSALALQTHALADSDDAGRAVDALAHAVAVLDAAEEPAPNQRELGRDWATGLVAHSMAFGRLGMIDEAIAVLDRRAAFLHPGSDESDLSVALSNRVEFELARCLRSLREAPFQLDGTRMRHVVAVSMEADAQCRRLGQRHMLGLASIVRAVEQAYLGDPQRALAYLDDEDCRKLVLSPYELWSYIRSAVRLRAYSRLGRSADDPLVREIMESAKHVDSLNAGSLILAWECLLFAQPELNVSTWTSWRYVAVAEDHRRQLLRTLSQLITVSAAERRAAAEHERMRQDALLDPLTRVLNRRGLQPLLTEAAEAPEGAAKTVFMLDVDGLKRVNDAFGHSKGDSLLQGVASILRGFTRQTDALARIGGDEFVLLADCDAEEAHTLAGRLREIVLTAGGEVSGVTMSVGGAVRTADVDPQRWLSQADEAMYQVKKAGGNGQRVVVDDPQLARLRSQQESAG
jgi:diguanylate cyclase (GGDEF)-like protein